MKIRARTGALALIAAVGTSVTVAGCAAPPTQLNGVTQPTAGSHDTAKSGGAATASAPARAGSQTAMTAKQASGLCSSDGKPFGAAWGDDLTLKAAFPSDAGTVASWQKARSAAAGKPMPKVPMSQFAPATPVAVCYFAGDFHPPVPAALKDRTYNLEVVEVTASGQAVDDVVTSTSKMSIEAPQAN